MKVLHFEKWVGTGNDFILVDNRTLSLKDGLSMLAKRLCDRKHSIGADGLILAERSAKSDLHMRIFNPDGSEAEMCGNGIRCLAKFAADTGMAKPKQTIETLAGVIEAEVKGDGVKVRMTDPKDFREGKLEAEGHEYEYGFLDTGVPHAVIAVPNLERVDVFAVGRAIRHHKAFAPRGTNANFIAYKTGNAIEARTYERGVEDVTLSSGTGSTASALIAAMRKGLRSPVTVHTRGGETLRIHFSRNGQGFSEVYMEGPVQKCFEGRVDL